MEQVVIEDYSSNWPVEYEKEAMKINKIFGDKVLGIEHIGSTSVEGLGAKPIIDFMVGISDLKEAEEFTGALQEIGYEYVFHKTFPNRRFYRKGEWRAGTHHLHVYKYGSEEWNHNIWFRDYLRSHPDALIQYNQLKKDLAEKHNMDRVAYTNAKHPFITEIIDKAKSETDYSAY